MLRTFARKTTSSVATAMTSTRPRGASSSVNGASSSSSVQTSLFRQHRRNGSQRVSSIARRRGPGRRSRTGPFVDVGRVGRFTQNTTLYRAHFSHGHANRLPESAVHDWPVDRSRVLLRFYYPDGFTDQDLKKYKSKCIKIIRKTIRFEERKCREKKRQNESKKSTNHISWRF